MKKINYTLTLIVVLGFALRLYLMITRGETMFLYSDDVGYLESAINFNKTGYITYSDRFHQTVFGMPGLFLWLSGIFKIFGHGAFGITVARFTFVLMSTATIYGVYDCTKKAFHSKLAGYFASIMIAVSVPLIALSNLFLTETVSLFIIVFLMRALLDFCNERSSKNFLYLTIWYVLCVMIKPTYCLFPIAFLPLMLYKKIPFKELLMRGVYVGVIVLMILTPWTLRNYIVTGDIIPLTGNQGDTKLFGTFSGEGFPDGTYDAYVMQASINVRDKGLGGNAYYQVNERGILAKERIAEWKETGGYYKTILWINPVKLAKGVYYPVEIFEISSIKVQEIYNIQLMLAGIGILGILLERKKRLYASASSVAIGFLTILLLNASYVALVRYGVQNMIIVYMLAGQGVYYIVKPIEWFILRRKNESISDNTSI